MPAVPSISGLLGPTLGLVAVYFIVLGAAYYLGARTAFAKAFFRSSTPPAIAAVVLFVGLYLIVVTVSAQFAQNARDFAYSVAAASFGVAFGWVLGIVISPSSTEEAGEFSLLTKAVSTFLTGYVLGYLKDITLENIQHFLARPEVTFRLMVGGACCLSSLATVFVIRRAEIMRSSAPREWFVSYAPTDPRHAQALRADVLAHGPFATREDAEAEIERIKDLDEFKGVTLKAVRVEILSEENVPPSPATPTPPAPEAPPNPQADAVAPAAPAVTGAAAGAGTGSAAANPAPALDSSLAAPSVGDTPASTGNQKGMGG